MISQDDLEALTPDERRDLARRLAVLTQPPIEVHPGRRHLFLAIVTGACIGLIPWILLLAVTSPPRYVAAHWTTTWVGFDAAELAALAATAWFAWKRRQALVLAAYIAGTLIVCDAWFDVTTARAGTDELESILAALLIELPLALVLFATATALLRISVRRTVALAGGEDMPRLRDLPLFGVTPRPD
jgi:hypothetical protein